MKKDQANSRRKILTLQYRHGDGGRSRRIYRSLDAFLKRGYEVHYLAADELLLATHPNLIPHIIPVPGKRLSGFVFWLTYPILLSLYALVLCIRQKFSAVVVFHPFYCLAGIPFVLLRQAPLYLLLSSVPWRAQKPTNSWLRTKASVLIYRVELLIPKRIIAVSKVIEDEVISLQPLVRDRVTTIHDIGPLPADEEIATREHWKKRSRLTQDRRAKLLSRFGLNQRTLLVSTCAELVKNGQVEYLVKAIASLSNPRISLVIIGDGPGREQLMSTVVGLGLNQQVLMLGWAEEPEEILKGSDLFVSSSSDLGGMEVLLLALGAGLPVLAPESVETRELLKYDELLYTGFHAGQLEQRFNVIVSNRSMLATIRARSLERAEALVVDWGDRVVTLLEKISSFEQEA